MFVPATEVYKYGSSHSCEATTIPNTLLEAFGYTLARLAHLGQKVDTQPCFCDPPRAPMMNDDLPCSERRNVGG